MIRNILWVVTLTVVLGIAAGGAYMFRYAPLSEDGAVWDRWTQDICAYDTSERKLLCFKSL